MIPKRRKNRHSPELMRRIFLGAVLVLLAWGRILACYGTLSEVEASFTTDIIATHIPKPAVENMTAQTVKHTKIQKVLSSKHNVRAQKRTADYQMAQRIRKFYSRWGSPMAAQAEYIVQVSKVFGLDPRLIPAISIVESSGGRHCFRPYNAFGWGKMSFSSFEQAIYTVAKGLGTGYRTSNPRLIAPSYNPVTPESWGSKVSSLMGQI